MKYIARCLVLVLLVIPGWVSAQAVIYPEKDYERLFVDVQMERIFPDNKTFADAIPLSSIDSVVNWYDNYKVQNGFRLDTFVQNHFQFRTVQPAANIEKTKDIVAHIEKLWTILERQPRLDGRPSSLIPLPHEYIVPGGRF